jgi:hypothetical protein
LRDVVAQYHADETTREAQVSFRVAGLPAGARADLHVRCDVEAGMPITRLVFRTGAAPFPITFLSPYVDAATWLGAEALLQGTFWLSETAGGWDVQAQGMLRDVDLDALVSRHFPQRLAGRADLDLEVLRWSGDRVDALQGTVRAGPGRISAALLHGMSREMGFLLDEPVPTAGEVPYEQLGMTFILRDGWLHVKGRCASSAGDAVMVGPQGSLLREPVEAVPAVVLVRALAPPGGVLVPTSAQTDGLLRVLPPPVGVNNASIDSGQEPLDDLSN